MRFMLAAACLLVFHSSSFGQAPQVTTSPSDRTPLGRSGSDYVIRRENRYEMAKDSIRRKAEFKAEQRSLRLETMKWYGYSYARPTSSTTPIFGSTISPRWSSTPPFHWIGGSQQTVFVVVPNEGDGR